EVMLLGVLVALIKIAELATVIPGIALFALGALVFVLAGMQASSDVHDVWQRIEWADPESAARRRPCELSGVNAAMRTGMQHGLQSCEVCGLPSAPVDPEEEGHCPRCGEELSFRKPGSIQRSWAFLIAAAVCYVPANLLPVLTTVTATGRESDTIL